MSKNKFLVRSIKLCLLAFVMVASFVFSNVVAFGSQRNLTQRYDQAFVNVTILDSLEGVDLSEFTFFESEEQPPSTSFFFTGWQVGYRWDNLAGFWTLTVVVTNWGLTPITSQVTSNIVIVNVQNGSTGSLTWSGMPMLIPSFGQNGISSFHYNPNWFPLGGSITVVTTSPAFTGPVIETFPIMRP